MNTTSSFQVALALALATIATARLAASDSPGPAFRPPSVPLVACDPYFSIWSNADRLTDDTPRHWTGRTHGLASLVRIDGKPFRVMGNQPSSVPALPQTSLEVLPTRTIYRFVGEGVGLTLTFMTPALPDDLEILARPVTYLTWDFHSTDGAQHAVALYFDNTAEAVVTEPSQAVVWSAERIGSLSVLKFGSKDQQILGKRGDDLRIDWGYLYTAAPKGGVTHHVVGPQQECRETFVARGQLPQTMDQRMPRAVNDAMPAAAFLFDLGRVGAKPVSRWLMLAYDDLYCIQYFRQNLRPYWRRHGAEASDLLKVSAREYVSLKKRCQAFDQEFMADMTRIGGVKYARICALAHRQCLAGNKLAADANGQPLLFPKENTSNGCIGTVDVIYPMAPHFLLFGRSLTKAMLVSNLDYASSPRWKFPFAPHDLGTYPLANAQVYGGGELTEENQMPVEETGNMLILIAALAQMEGNADFASKYWPTLLRWAEYLKAKGFDPENQLCTDDFAGHLAHNVNLSAKAILGIGAFGYLCDLRGDHAAGTVYRNLSSEFAARWVKEADDGDHFRLAFDRPGTWSQKYNLVWDRILGLNLFPASVLRKEMDYYLKIQERYGPSLDSRKPYAKLDWSLWTATLTGQKEDFDAITSRVYDFLNDTPSRVPMNDLYWTKDAKEVSMHARPVVGGVFLRALYDQALWKKWAGRDRTRSAGWAPLPVPPEVRVVVPTSEASGIAWRYTTHAPAEGWFAPGFNASSWQEGLGGFGTKGTPSAIVRTEWSSPDIWLRREFSLPAGSWKDLQFLIHHDEDAEVYINGVLASTLGGYSSSYDTTPISPQGKAALKPGQNTIAVHCHQTGGGQYIDVGIVELKPPARPR